MERRGNMDLEKSLITAAGPQEEEKEKKDKEKVWVPKEWMSKAREWCEVVILVIASFILFWLASVLIVVFCYLLLWSIGFVIKFLPPMPKLP
jgi:hypothetical protein